MFDRFTDRARRVFVLAQEEATALNHEYIGTEHVLLGLIRQGDGIAADALESVGATADRVRHQILQIEGRGLKAPAAQLVFSPRLKRVLEMALREALQL